MRETRFTSMEAALLSGVPFFTVDYWDRSKFLQPTVSPGSGRGRGRQRMYSYGDIFRLRIARELRDQEISLESLRRVVTKLAGCARRLPDARYVLVGRSVRLFSGPEDLVKFIGQRGRHRVFAILLDLTDLSKGVEERARRLVAAREGKGPRAWARRTLLGLVHPLLMLVNAVEPAILV